MLAVFLNKFHDLVDFDTAEASSALENDGNEPKLGNLVLALHVNVRRLRSIEDTKKNRYPPTRRTVGIPEPILLGCRQVRVLDTQGQALSREQETGVDAGRLSRAFRSRADLSHSALEKFLHALGAALVVQPEDALKPARARMRPAESRRMWPGTCLPGRKARRVVFGHTFKTASPGGSLPRGGWREAP